MKKNGTLIFILFIGAAFGITAMLFYSSKILISIFNLESFTPSLSLVFEILSNSTGKLHGVAQAAIVISFITPFIPVILYLAFASNTRALHGSARWATRSELKKAGLLVQDSKEDKHPSVILGKVGDNYLLNRGQAFVGLAAPTGSGKGVGIVIPNCLHYRDSMVILDTKSENFNKTAGFRAKCGQNIYRFAPDDENYNTDCWNPLEYVRRDLRYRITDLMSISSTLYPPSEEVWSSTAENLFIGLALYVLETPTLTETHFNLASLKALRVNLDCLKSDDTFMKEVAQRRLTEPLSEDCITFLRGYTKTSDKQRSSIDITFEKPLTVFADPVTVKATSSQSFDFRMLRKTRMSIYVCIKPANIDKFGALLNLFFEQLLKINMDKDPSEDESLKYQCLLMLDEFPIMGRIGIIEKASAYMRSYNIRLFLIYQSKGQLKAIYGEHGADNLMINITAQIYFAPRDNKDAQEYSDMLGQMTVDSVSKSRNLSGRTNRSQNVSEQGRALLLPQEVKEIGEEKAIVSIINVKPALVSKIFWYKERAFQQRADIPPPEIKSIEIKQNIIANDDDLTPEVTKHVNSGLEALNQRGLI